MNFIPTKIRKQIYSFAHELAAQQRPDSGAWINASPDLMASIITCQALQFLSSFRSPEFTSNIKAGIEWLLSPSVANSEYAYWRFMTLFNAGTSRTALKDALDHIREKIEVGVNHHPRSPIKEYYVTCCLKFGELDNLAKRLAADFTTHLHSPPKEWNSAKFCHAFTVVVLSETEKDEAVALKCLEHLQAQSKRSDGQRQWETLVETGYIVMNLIELIRFWGRNTNMSRKAVALATEGGKYLAKMWDQNNFESPPLAGGHFEPTPYNQIVVARALVELLDFYDPRWREEIIDRPTVVNVSTSSSAAAIPKSTVESIPEQSNPSQSHDLRRLGIAMPLLMLIVIVFGLLALACIGMGCYAIYQGVKEATTKFEFLGFNLSTTHVGVALVAVGLGTAFGVVGSILKKIKT